ncbi:hypothetical protein [Micromonospora sp. NPDC049645]|uniref:hypothetical protein n=1 Tax=Micromonospora sp. NPDC049645 TaxID=3155508 RepID=UPI0034284BC9
MDEIDARNVDIEHPTAADRAAVDEAIRVPVGQETPVQAALIARYFAAVCGDCMEGICHWGTRARREQAKAAGETCHCARHVVSVRWRT